MFQYSVILGNVGQCSDRYMTCGYGRPFEIPELFERVASIPGVTGIEYIGNWHLSDKTVHQIVDLQKQYGFQAVAIIPDHCLLYTSSYAPQHFPVCQKSSSNGGYYSLIFQSHSGKQLIFFVP